MKVLISLTLCFSSCLVFVACSTDPNLQGDVAGTFEYSIKGSNIKHQGNYGSFNGTGNGTFCVKVNGTIPISNTTYDFRGHSGANNLIRFTIVTDSLKAGSYMTELPPGELALIVVNGVNYTNYHPTRASRLSIRILRHGSGNVDGGFNGRLFKLDINEPVPTDSINVSGSFRNMQCIY